MTALAIGTIEKTKSLTILQRVANKDKTAVKDCIDAHRNFIWELARRFTDSPEEAETARREIFLDVWRHSRIARKMPPDESNLIALIAERRLLRRLQIRREKIYNCIDNRRTREGTGENDKPGKRRVKSESVSVQSNSIRTLPAKNIGEQNYEIF